jgi:hypothetical protein
VPSLKARCCSSEAGGGIKDPGGHSGEASAPSGDDPEEEIASVRRAEEDFDDSTELPRDPGGTPRNKTSLSGEADPPLEGCSLSLAA